LDIVRTRWPDDARAVAFVTDQERRFDFATLRFRDVDVSTPVSGAVHAQWRAAQMAAMLHENTVEAYRLAIDLFEKDRNLVMARSGSIDQLDYVVTVLGHLNKARSFASSLIPTGGNWFRGQLALLELARQQSPQRARQMWTRTWAEAGAANRPGGAVSLRER